ncbi:hypothetical protein [Neoroseomonas terrae]|nr:hypothetical protein [Neoroseomonas terrae]
MGGLALLPEAGGINQQPAWLINAFAVLDAAERRFDELDKQEQG